MKQLELGLKPKLAYTPETFLLHEGVKNLYNACIMEVEADRFSLLYVTGPRRCGKTHFSLALSLALSQQGFYPVLLEGATLPTEICELSDRGPIDRTSIFVIDDIDRYFSSSSYGDSGAFVHFVELLRVKRASLLLFSATDLADLAVDDHVRSRLFPGLGYRIGNPAEDDVLELLRVMARQRGIMLKERKRQYLLRRLRHDVESVERFLDRLSQVSNGEGRALRYSLLGDAI